MHDIMCRESCVGFWLGELNGVNELISDLSSCEAYFFIFCKETVYTVTDWCKK